jgi:hypothetical protein
MAKEASSEKITEESRFSKIKECEIIKSPFYRFN